MKKIKQISAEVPLSAEAIERVRKLLVWEKNSGSLIAEELLKRETDFQVFECRDAYVVVRSEAVLQEQQEFFCRYYVFNVKDNSLTEDNKELRFCFKTEENGEKKGLHMNFTEIINGEKIIAENFLIKKALAVYKFFGREKDICYAEEGYRSLTQAASVFEIFSSLSFHTKRIFNKYVFPIEGELAFQRWNTERQRICES